MTFEVPNHGLLRDHKAPGNLVPDHLLHHAVRRSPADPEHLGDFRDGEELHGFGSPLAS